MARDQGHNKQVITEGQEQKRRIEDAHDKWAEVAEMKDKVEETADDLLQVCSSFPKIRSL